MAGLQTGVEKRRVAGVEKTGAGGVQMERTELAPRRLRAGGREVQIRPQSIPVSSVGIEIKFQFGRTGELNFLENFPGHELGRGAGRLGRADGSWRRPG